MEQCNQLGTEKPPSKAVRERKSWLGYSQKGSCFSQVSIMQ